jgi:hypothetical protein
MHAVVRNYSGQGASELFDLIAERDQDIKDLIGGVPGFVSYVAVRTADGGTTVTVCEDSAGTEESSKRAAGFVEENLDTANDPPAISEGETVLQFGS